MKLRLALLWILFLIVHGFSASGVWIALEGDVDPGMNDFARRAIAEAKESSPDYILFEINTFGGWLDAAFDIVDTILAIKDVKTIALVKNKAISAGSLIALASQELYMMNGTTIGDCAPIVQGSDGTPQIVGEKIQSPLRAKFRNLAQKNHYPELLSSAMVTPELEVLELKHKDSVRVIESKNYEKLSDSEKAFWGSPRILVKEGELLTMTDKEAVELGFARKIIAGRSELEKILEITQATEVEIRDGERFARFLASISGLLLIIGFGALYMEFKTPGFGLFGFIGIAALALVFFGSALGKLDNFVPVVLLIVGILLFVVEILIMPGTFIFGVLGIIAMGVALVLTFDLNSLPSFVENLSLDASPLLLSIFYIMICALVALLFPFLLSKYIVPLLPEGWTPMLKTDLASASAPTENVLNIQIGDKGIAKTFLRPVGHASFNGQEFDVQTSDADIEPGMEIEVVKIQDSRIWVKRV